MNIAGLRAILPTKLYTLSCSGISRGFRGRLPYTGCCFSSSSASADEPMSENDVVNPVFVNRNPRNLEQMGIARKRKGWKFQYPSKHFYHKVMFDKSNRHVMGRVEHFSGRTVVSASTKEFAIAKHLYSLTDVSAAENVGHVLARRCLEAGITCMISQPPEFGSTSDKYQSFEKAVEQGGVDLSEPEEVHPDYEPGIDYNNEYEMQDLERRQKLVKRERRRTVFKYGMTGDKVKVKRYKD